MSVATAELQTGVRGGIELAKWLGVLAMLYDHLQLFAGWPLPWADHVGAFALPLFTVALAEALRDSPPGKLIEVGRRMLVWGCVAQVPLLFVREALPLNVLFTLGFATLGVGLWQRNRPWDRIAGALAIATTLVAEFALFGGAFVVVAMSVAASRGPVWWSMLAALPLFVFNAGSLMAIPATLLGSIVCSAPFAVPRIGRVFYYVYVLQWVVLAVL